MLIKFTDSISGSVVPLAMFRLWFERKKDRKARTPFYFYMLLHVEVWNEHIKVLYLAQMALYLQQ